MNNPCGQPGSDSGTRCLGFLFCKTGELSLVRGLIVRRKEIRMENVSRGAWWVGREASILLPSMTHTVPVMPAFIKHTVTLFSTNPA